MRAESAICETEPMSPQSGYEGMGHLTPHDAITLIAIACLTIIVWAVALAVLGGAE
jgi:hypothetical protein